MVLKYKCFERHTATGHPLHMWRSHVKWLRLEIIRIDPTEWDIEVRSVDAGTSFASKTVIGDARKAFTAAENVDICPFLDFSILDHFCFSFD